MTDKSIIPSSKNEQCDRSHTEPCLEVTRYGNRSKASILAQIYAEILNWPSTDLENQSAANNLAQEVAADPSVAVPTEREYQ